MSTDRSNDPLAEANLEDVLAALGQPYSTEILEATATPRSARELSDELDISIETSYRRAQDLADLGLLITYDPKGAGTTTYERAVDNLYIKLRSDPSVSSASESKVDLTLDTLWHRLD